VAPFVVDRELALQAAGTVHKLLDSDLEVSGQTVRVTASIGIALQELRDTSSTLIRNADSVTLTDSSRQQLDLSHDFLARHPSVSSRQMEASDLDFPDGTVDLVAMVRVMHHLPQPAAVLAEISRVLRPGGCAMIEVANSAHAMNRIRHLVQRKQIPLAAMDTGSRGVIPFVNHHPETVARQFADAGLQVRRQLSVSNLRHPAIKKFIPEKALLAVERAVQERVARTYFGPSMFYLLQK